MASLVKKVCSCHKWLGIFTVDVLPTTGIVSSTLVALLHDDWSACSTRAHSGDETRCRVQMCWNECELCSQVAWYREKHLQ